MDLLEELYNKKITLDEAYDKYDKIREEIDEGKYHSIVHNGRIDLASLLGMDKYEYTAFGHGAGLDSIAKWRYEGWPGVCAESGKKFYYKEYGWLVKEINGKDVLVLI
jgi:hypothetical protein